MRFKGILLLLSVLLIFTPFLPAKDKTRLDRTSTDAVRPGPIVSTLPRISPVASQAPGGGPYAPDPDLSAFFITVNEDPEGDMPRDLAFLPDGSEVVIVHRNTDNITFFDMTTLAAVHTVAVGDFPVQAAVTPDGRYVVVPNVLDDTVSLVDAATHTQVKAVPVTGSQPFHVAVTPDSRYAVVAVINDAVTSAFSIIDLDTQTEVNSFPTSSQGVYGYFWNPETGAFGNLFTQFALTPDGSLLVLPDRGNARVRLYDRDTGVELAALTTAAGPTAVDVSVDGTVAVVAHGGNPGTITEIDLVTRTVTGSFPIAASLVGEVVRITPDKNYAIAAISNNVIFVDLGTGATTSTVYTGTVGDIEISHDGQYAFVSNFESRVIDIASQSQVKSVAFAACADAAASPVENRAVALNNRFRENVHFYDIDGAAGHIEGSALSGEPEEGDGPLAVALSSDGAVGVVCNVISENVSVLDMATASVRSYVHVGDRPKAVAITPDGNYAVVCAMDADAVKIIDLSTDTVVCTLNIYNRPGQVRISPDSQYAYVLNVAGTDRISFIRLDGAASTIEKQLSAGQTGSALGYLYTETSGIELSHDGAVLAVCDSFNDLLRLFDTASKTQVAAVTVGDFPIRAAFSHDGTRVYVSNSFSDDLSVVQNNHGTWSLLSTVPNIDFPLTLDVDESDAYLYAGNAGSNAGIRVIDTATLTVVKTLLYPDGYPRDSALSLADSILHTASTGGQWVRIRAAGPASAFLNPLPISGGPSDLAFCPATNQALVAQPPLDGVDWIFPQAGVQIQKR